MSICNNFLLIEALKNLMFFLRRTKCVWSMIIKPTPTILTTKQHQRESINIGHNICYVVAGSRDLHKKYFCFK